MNPHSTHTQWQCLQSDNNLPIGDTQQLGLIDIPYELIFKSFDRAHCHTLTCLLLMTPYRWTLLS